MNGAIFGDGVDFMVDSIFGGEIDFVTGMPVFLSILIRSFSLSLDNSLCSCLAVQISCQMDILGFPTGLTTRCTPGLILGFIISAIFPAQRIAIFGLCGGAIQLLFSS